MDWFNANTVLANFADISRYPRESGSEKAVSDFIKERALGLGLDVMQDDLGNLIIKKPASLGYEIHDAVILQAHMDMVCEKRAGSSHDFTKDPIRIVIDGDMMHAEDTTLGADNGIGVAMALSILESDDLRHPPLEVVLTVQEETTFAGAANVDKSSLKATRMINLDHACDNELIIGSCGGCGVDFRIPVEREKELPAGFKPYRIEVSGLIGGHSGEDIHRGRGSAIELVLRVSEASVLPLVSIDGGSNRLSIPRDVSAVVLTDDASRLEELASEYEKIFRAEYVTAPELSVRIAEETGSVPGPLDADSVAKIRLALRSYPNGIVRMFDDMEGIVESSDNIGIVETGEDFIRLESEVRGSRNSTIEDILQSIEVVGEFCGAEINTFASYSPWKSMPDSPLKSTALEIYEKKYGEKMRAVAVHAGLESAFFAAADPGLDIISIGPTCENFHSPEERVSIASIVRIYEFLTELLSNL